MVEWINGIAKITVPTPFAVGDVHVYVIKGDRLTLIDAGVKTPAAWEAFKHQLKDLKLIPQDIEQVVLTHHHPDHIGMLDFFLPDLEVYGHPVNERWINRTADFMKQYDAFYLQLFKDSGVPDRLFPKIQQMKKTLQFACNRSLTGTLLEGDTPPGMYGWSVIETPGHAQSHIGLLDERRGLFIGGDHLLAHISSNPLLEPPLPGKAERPKPQLQYNESLKKLLSYPIEKIYPGHGPDVLNIHELVEKRLSRQHDRAMQVKEMIHEKPLTTFEICKRLFPKVYERELSLTMSETIAQIDYLQSLDQIHKLEENGQIFYC
ncbi:MBL fold metallo-hydrolase [Bacillus aquiflavi]|uniref:MBL fold metallo-hydrolase n=1 Tax=Bacillus aquiflavi TaxID=2672567 RepID=A0A6B3W3U1_9BACI|nr:MBL fold metallo-hydrolase [Bacillus aquiflavi]MBA4538202.1 MBL fold metallo-hydrolase [Bacillus aquiflavi]NEY82521.1 MBL fold metallo-hydrolase [Bacillus aquiflavi]UAC47163.1 MBL fold metallo-hydrolase [Bacillus aquiflavi]